MTLRCDRNARCAVAVSSCNKVDHVGVQALDTAKEHPLGVNSNCEVPIFYQKVLIRYNSTEAHLVIGSVSTVTVISSFVGGQVRLVPSGIATDGLHRLSNILQGVAVTCNTETNVLHSHI